MCAQKGNQPKKNLNILQNPMNPKKIKNTKNLKYTNIYRTKMNRIVRCLLPLHILGYQYIPIRILQVLYDNSAKDAFHSSWQCWRLCTTSDGNKWVIVEKENYWYIFTFEMVFEPKYMWLTTISTKIFDLSNTKMPTLPTVCIKGKLLLKT